MTDGDGVRIVRYGLGHAPSLAEAARESSALTEPWLPWCHPNYSEEEARSWNEARSLGFELDADEPGAEYQFAVEDAADGRFLGGIGLDSIRRPHGVANLGYWVRSSATGRGVATAAVRQLASWAFARTGLARLELLIPETNAASLRVAAKVGARREGLLRARLLIAGRRHDAWLHALVRPGDGD